MSVAIQSTCIVITYSLWIVQSAALGADVAPNFAREIRPILSNHCFKCHGPDEDSRQADFRLDKNGNLDPDSVLERITSTDPDARMPPGDSGLQLSRSQVEVLTRWLNSGAKYDTHWSFKPIVRPSVPESASHPVDYFIEQRLNEAALQLSPLAAPSTRIRRVHLDVTGLPPSPIEVDEFQKDTSAGAWQRLVDRVLDSPHYGEKWGRHWLDQARYADTNGYTVDSERTMWPWRDWVIKAINDDMPFDQFTIEQLAGDLLDKPNRDQQVATGFHRNTLINQEGGSDPEQFRNEAVVDRTNTTGAVWMGLTVGCAQCHTHKYDPLTHHEYYQLFAFFNSDQDVNSTSPTVSVPTLQQEERLAELNEEYKATRRRLSDFDKLHPKDDLSAELREKRESLKKATDNAKNAKLKFGRTIPRTMVMKQKKDSRDTHVLTRGDFLRPADRVEPMGPSFLPAIPAATGKLRTRLDLARWLVHRQHPLTARVAVNRIWMQLFGRGLVETENDFGMQGTPPTHPELLDWLAAEFMENGWSRKRLIRTILTSATYQQSSRHREESVQADPLNELLSRQSRVRVDAEIVRDLVLAVSGLLNRQVGGPGVYPPQPEGVYSFTQRNASWPTSEGPDRYRRGMYTFFMRSAPHPMLTTFDVPSFNTTCTRRVRSNTPLQSLTMANDEAFVEASRNMGRTLVETHDNDIQRLDLAWKLCFSRLPVAAERTRLLQFIENSRTDLERSPAEAAAVAGLTEQDAELTEYAVWTVASRAMLNLDEFITRE